ncbi:3-hydroxyacyl-CoA dehydrogenase/enoyl-CoA hydratase family protein [Derxia gummosa]|uniref:3-hydroxyacyl-CoA dehydrogenase/enoyl-CoA hydratase family protein n=1 Tax=Derxia gummosa DSM 723 TaxID=1121388 RepID=A0A8B6X415_9BURK|nr:3-hydroxyacyl-CoA dehydrogenase/enoyl-CoA hydratase family protein [Derxia gummosa]
MTDLKLHRVAVLGAGVMGAQIAAHAANAGLDVLLYDLAAPGADPRAAVRRAIDGLRKLKPEPLALQTLADAIRPCSYDSDLPLLAGCDLVIEAIGERLDWKQSLYERIAPHLGERAILASNTSGLSIATLAAMLPEALRPRFAGLHFFNPPRWLPLVELIGHAGTEPAVLDALESAVTRQLGKSVVRAKDSPGFIANRLGVFALLAAVHHAARFGLAPDEVDALTGAAIGRPRSATFRTLDVVGLDTFAHVVAGQREQLGADPWRGWLRLPDWLDALVAAGQLGDKTGAGCYRRVGRDSQVRDPATGEYCPAAGAVAPEVQALLDLPDTGERLLALRRSAHPQARFLWAVQRDLFHYAAFHLADIAEAARDADFALRWGFGFAEGPFETWQRAGWRRLASALVEDIERGETLAAVPLPAWVTSAEAAEGVHGPAGSLKPGGAAGQGGSTIDGANPAATPKGAPTFVPRRADALAARQLFPERLAGEPRATALDAGRTLALTDATRLWVLPERDARIGILSFTGRAHAIGSGVLDGCLDAIVQAECELDALVLWNEPPFAVGADLKEVLRLADAGEFAALDAYIARFQQVALAIRRARVPVVAAVQGMALGGGCEFALHAAHRVVAFETRIGLVETGVGLIPAGGGCLHFARRAAALAASGADGDAVPFLEPAFDAIARGLPAPNALAARAAGYLTEADDIVFQANEVLHVALARARALAEAGAVARRSLPVAVAGRAGSAALAMNIVNRRDGGFMSAHDARIAQALASALCGGDIDAGTRVDDDWLLAVERARFMELLATPETIARIRHLLATGKPLRN